MEEEVVEEIEFGIGHLWPRCDDNMFDHEYLFHSVRSLKGRRKQNIDRFYDF